MALIPSDAGLRMRVENELLPKPVSPVQEIATDLPRLQAGQLFTAQIREVLPQNTYLALVAGKQVTLSLPENAKSGDVLELVVIEQTPKSIIAGLARQPASVAGEATTPQTTLSSTAQMLRSLLVSEGDTPEAAPLNRGQPLLANPPKTGAELAPVLNRAVRESGLFYEAHQAQWIAGKLPLARLLQEPQGQIPVPAQAQPGQAAQVGQAGQTATSLPAALPIADANESAQPAPGQAPLASQANQATPTNATTPGMTALPSGKGEPAPGTLPGTPTGTGTAQPAPLNSAVAQSILLYQSNQAQSPDATRGAATQGTPPSAGHGGEDGAATTKQTGIQNTSAQTTAAALANPEAARGQPTPATATTPQMHLLPTMPDELRALVQQQLDAAGTQRLLWHGEVWPGQTMQWRLEWQQQGGNEAGEEDGAGPWQTKLRLTTPRLGSVEASLQLGTAGVRIALSAVDVASAEEMRAGAVDLESALSAAGVPLRGFTVRQAADEGEGEVKD